MSTEQNYSEGLYGYDDVTASSGSALVYGLNRGVKLKKFEWIPNGGKDGAEQEAADIVFEIQGKEKSYRMFPVTKAFDENNNEVTDINHPAFIDMVRNSNAIVKHIITCFVDEPTYRAKFARRIANYKEFINAAASLLPANFASVDLDLFAQYQWQISSGKNRTYLEIPKKMKYGGWITKALPGTFREVRVDNPKENTPNALTYINETGDVHPFTRNGWFVLSNFSKEQKTGVEDNTGGYSPQSAQGSAMNAGTADGSTQATEGVW